MASTSITNFSATTFKASEEPLSVIGSSKATNITPPSSDDQFTPLGTGLAGVDHGRNQAVLSVAFPATILGLEEYDPKSTYETLMAGGLDITFGQANTARAAESYLGGGYVEDTNINPGGRAGHLTHAAAPDLTEVTTEAETHNILNAYVPNVGGERAATAAMRTAFFEKYEGARNSFPPTPPGGGLDLDASNDAAVATLTPSETITRLGGWTHDTLTLGRWKAPDPVP
tara:strand:+ start:1791 stop:2477 length:687 start_codon:yes stop_codon:yes gene_type:complete